MKVLACILGLLSLGAAVSVAPPPHEEYARMARYIVHQSDFVSMATFSSREPFTDYPTANVFSMADGPVDKSSGVPYFYLTEMELSVHDLNKNNRASITMSLAQGDYCKENNLDPEDPRCAHIIMTGRIEKIDEEANAEEYSFAHNGLFSRHPAMGTWPAGHGWFVAKMKVENILLLDWFGGAQTIKIDDYMNATPQ